MYKVNEMETENEQVKELKNWRDYRNGNHLELPDGSLWMINSRKGVAVRGSKKDIEEFENCDSENEEENPLIAAYGFGIENYETIILEGMMLSD